MLKAKRKLTNISFESEGSAVALVGPHQGSGANNWKVLLTKSTDHISKEQLEESLSQVDKDMSSSEGVTNQTEGNPLSDNHNKEDNMSEEMVAKSAVEAMVAKAVEEAVNKAVEEKEEVIKAKDIELQGLTEQVKSLEAKEKEAVEKSRKLALKEAGVAEDKVEVLYKAYESLSAEQFNVVVDERKAINKALTESDMFKERGVSGESESVETDGVEALTKSLQQKYNAQKEGK